MKWVVVMVEEELVANSPSSMESSHGVVDRHVEPCNDRSHCCFRTVRFLLSYGFGDAVMIFVDWRVLYWR